MFFFFFFFQAEDGIRDHCVTGVQTCALPVYYAGEMCRRLIDAPPVLGENHNPVRLFAGSGLRAGLWRRLVDRFGPVAVLEMYASTEAHIVLANARGRKLGSVGRPL